MSGSLRALTPDECRSLVAIIRDPLNAKIEFKYRSSEITHQRLLKVADYILNGMITVYDGPALGTGTAYYDPQANQIVVNSPPPKTLGAKGLFLHECCHAVSDVFQIGEVPHIQEEVTATVSQHIYYRLQGHHNSSQTLPAWSAQAFVIAVKFSRDSRSRSPM